jgi:hypothetical protein
MVVPLIPCPACARHVRLGETSCPFCRAAVPLREVTQGATQQPRVNRATLFAFGASLAVASCASPTVAPPYGAPTGDMAPEAGADVLAIEAGPTDAGFDSGFDARVPDDGTAHTTDGGPADGAADMATDASTDDVPDADGSTAGPYGAPPWPDGF